MHIRIPNTRKNKKNQKNRREQKKKKKKKKHKKKKKPWVAFLAEKTGEIAIFLQSPRPFPGWEGTSYNRATLASLPSSRGPI